MSVSSDDPETLYTPLEAAAFLTTQHRTLERWRANGTGPTFIKVGRRVAYRRADLLSYIERQARRFTREVPAP